MTGIGDYLTLENLKENREMISGFVAQNYLLAVLLFIGIYILATGLSIPGATVLTLSGGFLFGAFWGTLYVNIGATIGATVVFLLAKYLIGKWAEKKYAKQFSKLQKEIKANGYSYLLTLRFIPLFPFFLINLVAGVVKVPLLTFIWTTSLGIIPGSFAYAYAGTQLASINSLGEVLSPQVLLAFVFLGIVAIIPTIYNKIKNAKKSLKG